MRTFMIGIAVLALATWFWAIYRTVRQRRASHRRAVFFREVSERGGCSDAAYNNDSRRP